MRLAHLILPLLSFIGTACAKGSEKAGRAERGGDRPERSAPPSYYGAASPLLLKELLEIRSRADVGGRLGISVYSTRFGRFEASLEDSRFFTPASCLKLVVTAAALDAFPMNYFPSTTMRLYGFLQGEVLTGRVVVHGGGDPNISGRFFPDEMAPLRAFADSLKRMGIREIRGRFEFMDTFFTGPRRPDAWKAHHFNSWYGAEVSALSYNDNCFNVVVGPGEKPGAPAAVAFEPDVGYVKVRNLARTVRGRRRRVRIAQHPGSNLITVSGSIGQAAHPYSMTLPVRDPTGYFRAALLTALSEAGINFKPDGEVEAGGGPIREFRFVTAPLINAVEEVNQRSQNLHAEMLLRHLGRRVFGEGSAEAGLRAEKLFLQRMGVDSADFVLRDACGLSHENRVKPRALALFLARMARHPYAKDYIRSLYAPGQDGVTGNRLRPYGPQDIIKMKTGSINGVQGLSGYVFGVDGDTLAVSLFANGFHSSSHAASLLLDSLYAGIAMWYNKERQAVIDGQTLLLARDAPPAYRDRLRYFSRALEGRPYFLGPTGEGRFAALEPRPLMELGRFDCVTYIESVMALAKSRSGPELLPALQTIRYAGDTVAYRHRNHFFVEDWLRNNPESVRIRRFSGDTVISKPIHKIEFFRKKGLPGPAEDPVCEIPFLPYAKALDLMEDWEHGEQFLGVAFVTGIAGLDVTHTGFLVADGEGPPRLRHASSSANRVATQDFHEYLLSRKGKCTGVLFFEFL